MIVAGATVQRVDPTAGHDAYVNIVINVLRNVAVTLQIQRELVDEKLNLNETGAGKILDEQIRQATEALRRDLDDVNQRLKDEQNKHGKRIQDLEEEKVDLRRDLDQMKQNREALEQQFEGLKISEETRVKNMQKMIDDLRREQQEQQRRENERQEQQRLEQQRLDQQREQQRLEWQLYEQQRLEQQRLEQQRLEQQRLEQQRQQQQGEVSAPAYGITLNTACTGNNQLTVVDQSVYANGSWDSRSDGRPKLVIPGSGNSGLVRYRLSNGEYVAVAVGVHNYVRWCDFTTDVPPPHQQSLRAFHERYYRGEDSQHSMLWRQEDSWTVYTPRGKALSVYFTVGSGHEMYATVTNYDNQV
jgi:hypothetical protein